MSAWRGLLATLSAIIVGALAAALLVYGLLSYQHRELSATIEATLRSQVLQEAQLVARILTLDPAGGIHAATDLIAPHHRRVTVIARDGHVIFDSQADPRTMVNHNQRPEVVEARAHGVGSSRRVSETTGDEFVYAAVVLPDGRVVRVAEPFIATGTLMHSLLVSVAGATLLVTACALLAVLILQLRATGRFHELQAVSQSFARGDFTRRVAIAGQGSYSRIGTELNHLGERLQVSLAALEEQRRLLDSALDALDEGVCCLDRLDRVVYANPAYRQLAAGGADVTGQLFYEHLPATALSPPLAKVRLADSREGSQAIELEHRRRQLRAVVVPAGSGLTVLVLHDLTESRSLEQSRRDFMAAVSHEFKTPLTAIVGFTESLLAGGIEDHATARSFAEGIARQADRLSNLVHDVLTLARLEHGGWEVRPTTIDLASFAESLLEQFRPLAAAKRVQLQYTLAGPGALVVDPELLQQLLGNLLSNAIRYNREHGSVWLHLVASPDALRCAVQDTGPGIPPEHQPRIFERFYRVDAHRSRQTGGTGLGLAIVKQLLELLGGDITLFSDAGGSRFDITIPRRGRVVEAAAAAPAAGPASSAPALATATPGAHLNGSGRAPTLPPVR